MSKQVDLRSAADQSGSLEEQRTRAQIQGIKHDNFLRIVLVLAMITLFVALNFFVIDLISRALDVDVAMIQQKQITPADRLITDNVLVSLIGATVVQLGAVILAMAHYFFPKGNNHP